MKSDTWAEDWKIRVYDRIIRLGFEDATSLLASAPATPYRQLASKLGKDIAPVQLEKLMREEAMRKRQFSLFARDCLVRYLNQDLPQGWGRSMQADFNVARAFASWSAALSLAENAELKSQTDRVWKQLHQLASVGWQPTGADDPVILEAFDSTDFNLCGDL